MPRLGVGIVTFNRRSILRDTIDSVRAMTAHEPSVLVVADDGSTDGTPNLLRLMGVAYVTGRNMGIAWNKNRALYLLFMRLHCDVIILLEDDTRPTKHGWESPFIAAAEKWGHVNWAPPWFDKYVTSGSGTPDDPFVSGLVTAQCSAYHAAALERAGYFDSRFRGFGHEHVEHSARFVRMGFGGHSDRGNVSWKMLAGDLTVAEAKSHSSPTSVNENLQIAHRLMGDQTYRAPWRDDEEMDRFLAELEAAHVPQDTGFILSGARAASRQRHSISTFWSWMRRFLRGRPDRSGSGHRATEKSLPRTK